MSLTEKLISLRKEKGLTQLDLAEQLHVSRQAISRWEVGAAIPSTDNLKILSELYGVPVDYLLHDGAQRPAKPAEFQEEKPAEQPPAIPPQDKRKHRYLFLYVMGIILAIAIGIVIGATIIPRQEKEKVTSINDITEVVEDGYPSITFSFE